MTSSSSGVFLVTPTTAAFGSVPVGESSSMKVSLVNKTLSAVEISAASITGSSFAIVNQSSFPVTVASGGTYAFTVQFAPSTVGTTTGQITVATNVANASATVVGLSGTGTTASSSTAAASTLSCTSSTITGSGTTTCSVGLSSAAGSGGVSVSLASDNSAVTVPSSVTVADGATTASFTATATAVTTTQTATLTATANGGTATVSLTLNASSPQSSGPQLSVNASSIAFGDVLVGNSATQSLTLTSTGTTTVTVNSATLTGAGFLISSSSFPATLTPGQTATLTVQFSPTVAGNATGSLAIASTSQTNPTNTVALSGTGMSVAVALTWDAPTSTTDTIAGYRMYRALSGSSTYALLGSISASNTAYTDSSIASGTTYAYYVTAVDSSGAESVPSNTATVAVP